VKALKLIIRNYIIFGLIGFSSTGIQIIFLREFFKFFNGNELSVGIVLASWLFWTAGGSYFAGKLKIDRVHPLRNVIIIQTLTAYIAPLTIILIRFCATFLTSAPGEMPGMTPMVIISFLLLSLLGLTSGASFTFCVLLLTEHAKKFKAISSVYMIEGIGSAFAGLLLSLVLIHYFNNLYICFLISIINSLAASLLIWQNEQGRFKTITIYLNLLLLAALIFFGSFIETKSKYMVWAGFVQEDSYQSEFGEYNLISTGRSKTIYLNGSVLLTIPNQASAEEDIHFVMLQHPEPKNILLLGGGLNGSVNEILKYPSVKQIDYVETDKVLFKIFKDHFPDIWNQITDNPKVKCFTEDGRLFLKHTFKNYDVIILIKPDPQTAQMNRFYTKEFFQIISRHLNPSGIFSFQSQGSENYINQELASYLNTHYHTLKLIFNKINIYPGNIIHFFASQDPRFLTTNSKVLIERLNKRNINTQYINKHILPFRLNEERIDYLNEILKTEPDYEINTDFHPAAYYYNAILWSGQFNRYYSKILITIYALNPGRALSFTLLILIISFLLYILLKKKNVNHILGALSVFCMGFTGLGIEILILLFFQVLNGYVYKALAVLIASFMAGLSFGAYFSMKNRLDNINKALKNLFNIHLLTAIFIILLPYIFRVIDIGINYTWKSEMITLLFIFVTFLAGGIGGYIFPLAGLIFYIGSDIRNNGFLYSMDLAGSMISALLISAFIIPIAGLLYATFLLAGFNILIALFILAAYLITR
jgi:spermidine synthase